MTRRVTLHKRKSVDGEELMICTIYENGIDKERIKKENVYSKRHFVLAKRGEGYEFVK